MESWSRDGVVRVRTLGRVLRARALLRRIVGKEDLHAPPSNKWRVLNLCGWTRLRTVFR
jgi:hypothetical protein